jgi:hypothetical protein
MNLVKCLLFITLFSIKALAQKDSAAYGSIGFQLNEGLYLNFQQLKSNKPISKEQITSRYNTKQLDFLTELTKNEDSISIKINEKVFKIDIDSVWGYCQNNQIYISNGGNDFFKVPLFGSLSTYLVFVKQTNTRNFNPWMYDPYFNNVYPGYTLNGNNTNVVTIQMLLDAQTGTLFEFSLEQLDSLLMRDADLYKEYRSLSKKKRRSKAIFYLRKYNIKHPIYFPKN